MDVGADRAKDSRPRGRARDPVTERGRIRRTAFLLFLTSFLVYNANLRLIGTGDSIPARLIPLSLLRHGTFHLDEFGPRPSNAYWLVASRAGRLVSFYPVVLPVLVTPLFLPTALYVDRAHPTHWGFLVVSEVTEKVAASFIAALSVAVLWLVLRRIASPATATVLALAYAFGTQTWSTSSQALWQHGLGELLLAFGLLLLFRPSRSRSTAALLGATMALLALNRPPDALFSVAVGAWFLIRRRDELLPFAIGGAVAAAPFLAYNLTIFGRPLGGYQSLVGSDVFGYDVPEGIAALLVSPGKGLLVYAPFLLFLLRSPLAAFELEKRSLGILLWSAFLLQILLYSTMDWTAGACYGPRFLTDAMPFLIVCLAPAVDRLRRPAARAAFGATVLFAVWVQAVGAFCFPAGGSYLASRKDLWRPSFAQFLVEAQAGLAAPEFFYRARDWRQRHFASE